MSSYWEIIELYLNFSRKKKQLQISNKEKSKKTITLKYNQEKRIRIQQTTDFFKLYKRNNR